MFCSIDSLDNSSADVIYLHSSDTGERSVPQGTILHKQYTLLTDLQMTEEDLWSEIKKTCRYEIRRSEREEVQAFFYRGKQLSDEPSIVDRFEWTYNQMFKAKGLEGYRFNRNLVEKALETDNLVISFSSNSRGDVELFHAYLCDDDSCVLMYSASSLWGNDDKEKANEIGRMNKFLHWKDIQCFKESGLRRYEWGGISSKDNPNGIDRFKMEFGGRIVQYNNYIIPNSLVGRLYTFLVRRKTRENANNN